MNFPSIDIQGSILSNDLLGKIRTEQANFQHGKDFSPELTNAKLKDEISLAWQEAKGQWTIYKSKLARLKDGETGTTETRNFWISPLLTNLGYNLTFDRKAEEIDGKTFPIGYRDSVLDNFPIYVGGYHESLDRRPENRQLKVSPHAMLQEYLNSCEHLYGIVTNGQFLRLLRDASRITRLSYLEFNLEKMMEEDLYSDFVILYRVLHASRMPKMLTAGGESIIEKYHQEGLEAGSTIRDKLGDAVKGAILNLANGFINHPENGELRESMLAGHLNAKDYYRHQLRIIYRLLFLFVIEERNLVYGESRTPETRRFNEIYYKNYSLLRLRKLARKIMPPEANRYNDLWKGLISTFSLFEKKEIGEKLGIMSLQGDLFGYEAIKNSHYDLHQCQLSNAVLLDIIKAIGYFENPNGVLSAVNYGGLDVEEFGSIYEGLLELKININPIPGSELYSCAYEESKERSKSGSHYTPEELVQPLIKHSLEYLIEDRTKSYLDKKTSKDSTIASLLNLKIADVACGSGHILLSAARRLALEVARVQTDEEQPNPLDIRKAMKAVVKNCIYGVDKNPLAVELCKIALWLEAYNPGEPLNFLDHHIKCGDAIVGLAHRVELQNGIADEAFKTLPGDDKDIATTYRKQNQQQRKIKDQIGFDFSTSINDEINEVIKKYNLFKNLPETTPEEVEKKARMYTEYQENTTERIRMKQLADAQVAQFFIPKTDATKPYLLTDAEYRSHLRNIKTGLGPIQSQKLAYSESLASEERYFHWFLEFPEVFNDGGFDTILGNPPYLGGSKVSSYYGIDFYNFLKSNYAEIGGQADYVTFFVRRIYDVIKKCGFLSIITTNTISQGDTRKGGLDYLINNYSGEINFAVKSIKWPGIAVLEISLFAFHKGKFKGRKFLNGKETTYISSLFGDVSENNPEVLISNSSKSFKGSDLLGTGFTMPYEEASNLILLNEKNKEILFPFINGEDLNNSVTQEATRFVINFFDWSIEKAKQYKVCFKIIEESVLPERLIQKDKIAKEKYWIYLRRRPELYQTIKPLSKVLLIAQTSKTVAPCFVANGQVYSTATIAFASDKYSFYSILQSTLHNIWAWKYGSTMKTDLRYTPTDVFETFPFPQNLCPQKEQQLEAIGEAYHENRKQLMLGIQLGLTKTYNLFHSNAITELSINDKDKLVVSLKKHLEKSANTFSFDEAIQGILKLHELHVQMDEVVLDAYGWNDVALKHDFYEVDYLPENDRVRFTIHPDARKEVLKRLLELNHKIHEEEVAAGLWEKKKAVAKKVKKVEETGFGGLFDQTVL